MPPDAEATQDPNPTLLSLDGLPLLSGGADERPFVLAGERAALVGVERSGVTGILLHPLTAARELVLDLPPAERVEISSALSRRHLSGGGGLVETAFVLYRLTAVVLRWERAPGSGRAPWKLSARWRSPGTPAEPAGKGLLRIRLDDAGGSLLFSLRGGSARWETEESPATGETAVQLLAEADGSTAVELLATVDRDGGIEASTARARMERLEAEIRSRIRAEERDATDALAVQVDHAGTGRALAWGRRRIGASVVRPEGRRPGIACPGYGATCGDTERGAGDPSPAASPAALGAERPSVPATPLRDLAWVGLGLLAAGLHRTAGEVMEACGQELARLEGAGVATADRLCTAALLLRAVSLHALWTGDSAPLGRYGAAARGAGAFLRASLDTLPESSPPPVRTLVAAALRDGADALEGAVIPEAAADLRDELEGLPELPDGWVRALLPERADTGRPPGRLDAGLRILDAWEGGDPDVALASWQELLAGTAAGGRALWGSGAGCPWDSAVTAFTLLPFVFGFLGARADSAYGRLRLAPRVPSAWTRMRVENLRVADVSVRLSYRRSGPSHTFVLEPTAGRIPLNAVFEPTLPLASVAEVRVGGEPAEVDVRRERGRCGIRLQLPLDARREITVVDGEEPRG